MDLHTLIHERRTDPGAYYFPDLWWEKEVAAITADLDAAIAFIRDECSDEDLYWLGEIFDDVMEKAQSTPFLDCLRQRVNLVENPEWRKSLTEDLQTASEYAEKSA